MGTFAIYAIVLTIIYIIYYGIVISQEVIKTKKRGKDNSETFAVSDMIQNNPDAKSVVETADGKFAFAEDTEEPESLINETQQPDQQTDQPVQESGPDEAPKANIAPEIQKSLKAIPLRRSDEAFTAKEMVEFFQDLNHREISQRVCLIPQKKSRMTLFSPSQNLETAHRKHTHYAYK